MSLRVTSDGGVLPEFQELDALLWEARHASEQGQPVIIELTFDELQSARKELQAIEDIELSPELRIAKVGTQRMVARYAANLEDLKEAINLLLREPVRSMVSYSESARIVRGLSLSFIRKIRMVVIMSRI